LCVRQTTEAMPTGRQVVCTSTARERHTCCQVCGCLFDQMYLKYLIIECTDFFYIIDDIKIVFEECMPYIVICVDILVLTTTMY
jgi:hypothetical protein